MSASDGPADVVASHINANGVGQRLRMILVKQRISLDDEIHDPASATIIKVMNRQYGRGHGRLEGPEDRDCGSGGSGSFAAEGLAGLLRKSRSYATAALDLAGGVGRRRGRTVAPALRRRRGTETGRTVLPRTSLPATYGRAGRGATQEHPSAPDRRDRDQRRPGRPGVRPLRPHDNVQVAGR